MNTLLQTCKGKKQSLDDNSLQVLVDDYIHRWGDSYDIEDRWWGEENLTWDNALERAWKSRFENGKMHGHQCRVAGKLPEGLQTALSDRKQPEDFYDFQILYCWVKSVTGRVSGLGATTAYDVARRLSVKLRLEPVNVYLHAGSAIGARKFGIEGESAPLSKFPKEIQSLGATHAENFLCIYKDSIESRRVMTAWNRS